MKILNMDVIYSADLLTQCVIRLPTKNSNKENVTTSF